MTEKTKYKFKQGQKLHLDQIYTIQGIENDSGQWWEHDDKDNESDDITVTQDIEITITVKTKATPRQKAEALYQTLKGK